MFEECCREKGAIIVDNLEIDNIDMVLNPGESGESKALAAEFKLNINEYMRQLITSPVRSLADIIAFNNNSLRVNTCGFLFLGFVLVPFFLESIENKETLRVLACRFIFPSSLNLFLFLLFSQCFVFYIGLTENFPTQV